MSLDDCQSRFAHALSETAFDDAPLWVKAGNLAAGRRLWVYHNQIHIVRRDALVTTYPAITALVGRRYFWRIARAFARTHISTSGNLKDYGEGLPDYLETRPEICLYPYIPDVARLEWARTESVSGPEEEALTPASLADLTPAAWSRLRCRPAASLRLVSSAYPIAKIWAAALSRVSTKSAQAALTRQEAAAVAVYRIGSRVAVETLSPATWRWLLALQDGRTLATAIELACEVKTRMGTPFDLVASLQWAFDRRLIVEIGTVA